MENLKIAIIHDWLVTYAGAERVLEQMLSCFPQADLFSIVDFLPEGQRDFIQNKDVKTSFIQRLPLAKKKYRTYLPLMPLAVEQFDLSSYDLVISSSHAVAKGVITGPDQLHISYIHSPMRYAWDLQYQYLKESNLSRGPKSWMVRYLLHRLRLWDLRSAQGVDHMIANSAFISQRIQKAYRRRSNVIYPPVDTEKCSFYESKDDFYLAASRMVPYKKIDLIVDAFTKTPNRKLFVVGDGPEFKKVKSKAKANIKILGHCSSEKLKKLMQRAKAFVFAAEEDFGIIPVEVQACGTPVIAYGKGGVLETVRPLGMPQATGVFFTEQKTEDIIKALDRFEAHYGQIKPSDCRKNALRFNIKRFKGEFFLYVETQWEEFKSNKNIMIA